MNNNVFKNRYRLLNLRMTVQIIIDFSAAMHFNTINYSNFLQLKMW